jgi:hypothetical protein
MTMASRSPSYSGMPCMVSICSCVSSGINCAAARRSADVVGVPTQAAGNPDDRRHRITHVVSTVTEVAKARGRKVRSLS